MILKKKKIEEKIEIKTNFTNFIELKKSIIKPEIFLVTDKYLGVPIYIYPLKENMFLLNILTHLMNIFLVKIDIR